MDFSTMQTEVRERLGELSADFFSDAEIKRALNEGQRRFSSEEPWPWLLTEWSTTVNTEDLELPEGISLARVFNISAGEDDNRMTVLERLEPSAGFRARFRYTAGSSYPSWYYVAARATGVYTIRFVPFPSDGTEWNVEALYHRVPDDMSAGTDTPDVPEEYDEAIVAWATGKLWLKEFGVSQKASEQFSMYQKVVDQARKDVMTLQQDEDVAWGREMPEYRFRSQSEWISERIPPTLG